MATIDPHGPAGPRGYKRSWRNLLINKRYQLRFTFFMVGLATAVIAGLGWWVMKVADDTTNVAVSRVRGESCTKVPAVSTASTTVEGNGAGSAPEVAVPLRRDEDGSRRVQLDVSSMTLKPVLASDYAEQVALRWACELVQAHRIRDIEAGRRNILYFLITVGVVLATGLFAYGIVMTHKVAGPLFKIRLYFKKMREGRYDQVYDLRKGDQLVDFYAHFKHAHAGVVALERADVDRLRATLAAIDRAGTAGTSPEVDAAVAELREILTRKEKSLE